MDIVDAGYASDMTGCFTARGAFGALFCFLRWALCDLISSSLVSLREGTVPALGLLEELEAAVLFGVTVTAMMLTWDG